MMGTVATIIDVDAKVIWILRVLVIVYVNVLNAI